MGIRSLLAFLKDHEEAVEADFQRFYHLNLWAALGGPTLPFGRLARLLRQLPSGAALWRSMHGEDAEWTLDRHLLAGIYDALAAANWQRGNGKRKDRPKPLPRPGSAKPSRTGDASRLTPVDARALIDARKPKGVTPSP